MPERAATLRAVWRRDKITPPHLAWICLKTLAGSPAPAVAIAVAIAIARIAVAVAVARIAVAVARGTCDSRAQKAKRSAREDCAARIISIIPIVAPAIISAIAPTIISTVAPTIMSTVVAPGAVVAAIVYLFRRGGQPHAQWAR